jgi:hypothetical protein
LPESEEKIMSDFILTELYKGRVQIKFFPGSHQYWVSVDGGTFKRKTGVTSHIGIKDKSKPLGSWQQGMTLDFLLECIANKVKLNEDKCIEAVIQHELYLEKATDIGHEIHGWAESFIRHKLKQEGFKELPDIPNFPEAVTGVNAFMEWQKKHKIEFVSTETMVYSLEHDYIGTEDVVFIADGKYCDADFKSSNGLYNGVRMQTAAYAKARMEAGGRKSQGRWAIRFSKYNEEEYIKRETRKAEIRKFIAKYKGREVKDYPIKPYKVFEAKFLDESGSRIEKDFSAFLNAKALNEWDKTTDPFLVGEDW